VLRVLSLDLARIATSAALLGPTPHRTFQHRVASDFIQAQAWRAAWVAKATAAIVSPPPASRLASLGSIVDRVKAGFESESRLTRLLLDCSVSAPAAAAGFAFDDDLGTTALTGCVFATIAWLEGVGEPRVEVRADAPNSRTLKIEVVQRAAAVPSETARYLRERVQMPSTDLMVALGLLAAKSFAVQNSGSVELTPIAGGGSIIQSTFSKPNAN
jgi:hypothetical protein